MKTSSLFLPFVAVAFLTLSVAIAQTPQASQPAPPAAGAPHEDHDHQHHAAPTNLKVLPKTLTGEQVHEIMEGWEAALGTHCDTCHMVDPKNIGPNGRPRLNFPDDTKQEKSIARMMFKMTEDINQNYVAMVENSGAPVTCGTCHRGHLTPQPFIAPKEDHEGPHPPQTPPPAEDKPEKPQ